jgi:hypothetical protein
MFTLCITVLNRIVILFSFHRINIYKRQRGVTDMNKSNAQKPNFGSTGKAKYIIFLVVFLIFTGCSIPQEQSPSLYPNTAKTGIGETDTDKALNYVVSTSSIPKEKLIIYEQESVVLDQLLNENVHYFAIGDNQSVIAKIVVDSSGKVSEVSEYQKSARIRYLSTAGNMNPSLYKYLSSIGPDNTVEVSIITNNSTTLAAFIRSRGFEIDINRYRDGGNYVYAVLPKYFILELAKTIYVGDIERVVPTTTQ